ncbi:MAG: hypothetical protein PHV19_04370 [Bacilli bacterium]|jgi:hypothetical protein|nr:hypothetical protein [Bacilli bacterium]
MNDIKTLIIMQLKDKLDIGFIKDRAQLIRKIVFFVVRFLIVAAIAFGLFFVSSFLKIFHNSPFLPTSVMTMVMTIILLISTFTCTIELIKSLYMSQDNQVLITYPISANRVFLSKIVVFYIYEIYKNVTFTLPIFIAYGLLSPVSWFFYIWVFLSFFFISMIPVVLGVVLSIPGLFIMRFLNRFRIIKVLFFILILGAFIYILANLFLLIPNEINVLNYWGPIKVLLSNVTDFFQRYFLIIYALVIMVVGKYDVSMNYSYLNFDVWLIFLSLILVMAILFFSVYFLSRFIFIKMTSASFEFEKRSKIKALMNRRLPRFFSFILKELRLISRTGEFTYNFIATYVSIPLFILLINQIFSSMDLYANGQFIVQSFNILIIMLPLLASNSLVATMYSKEGRTAYLKRTKPVAIIFPLLAKLLPNIVLSLVSLGVSLYIFNDYFNYIPINIAFLCLALAFVQIGHLLFCALMDLMNPQNEQYATAGEQISNPNEIKATIFAFILAFLVALITLAFLLEEQFKPEVDFNLAFLKIALIGMIFVGVAIYMFVEKIKAYYYDRVS